MGFADSPQSTSRSSTPSAGGKRAGHGYRREMVRVRQGHYRRLAFGNRIAWHDIFFSCSVFRRPPPYTVIDPWKFPSERAWTSRKAKKPAPRRSEASAARSRGPPCPPGPPVFVRPPEVTPLAPLRPHTTCPAPPPRTEPSSPPLPPPIPEPPAPAPAAKKAAKGKKKRFSFRTGVESRSRVSEASTPPTIVEEPPLRPPPEPALATSEETTAASTIPREPPKLPPPAETRGPPTLRQTLSRKKSDKAGEPAQKIVVSIGSLRGRYKGELKGQAQAFLLCGTTQDNLEQLLSHVRNKSPLFPLTLSSSGEFCVDFGYEFVLPLGPPTPFGMRISVVCTRETTLVDMDGKRRFSWRLNDIGSIVSPMRDMTTSQTVDWDTYPLRFNARSGFEAENLVIEAKFVLCPDSQGPPIPPDEIQPFQPPAPPKAKIQKQAKHAAAVPPFIPPLPLTEDWSAFNVTDKRCPPCQPPKYCGNQDVSACLPVDALSVSSERSSASLVERIDAALKKNSSWEEKLAQKFCAADLETWHDRGSRKTLKRHNKGIGEEVPTGVTKPGESLACAGSRAVRRPRPGAEDSAWTSRWSTARAAARVESGASALRGSVHGGAASPAEAPFTPHSWEETFRLTSSPSEYSEKREDSCASDISGKTSFRSEAVSQRASHACQTGSCAGAWQRRHERRQLQSAARDSEAKHGTTGFHRARIPADEAHRELVATEIGKACSAADWGLRADFLRWPGALTISPPCTSRSGSAAQDSKVCGLLQSSFRSDKGIAGRVPSVRGMRRFPPPKKNPSRSSWSSRTSESEAVSTARSGGRSMRDGPAACPRISSQAIKPF
ncbi:hypothetical protein BESB_081560 [Besnoitia besnoiti]|uniref:Uncharacterized protein n=1 Tax=Besnoitia besnoiti TaxID=94643 RepID=A0A2A9MBG1_BESBE|nr:hypothetical protein BESB_081560 [Besnoitia besnoiti]PFH32957.1 hypothetical protein BESB_081560 [Besnoitia besnoiti]